MLVTHTDGVLVVNLHSPIAPAPELASGSGASAGTRPSARSSSGCGSAAGPTRSFAGDKGGWRLDHVLVAGLRPVASAYAHDWRRAGLSDRSALLADLDR